jgi:D-glycero-D-manno-heptose 1,7-bisphosphate phosphatase
MAGSARRRAISEIPKPAVFLDRDGVLNAATVVDGVPHPPRSAEEMEILPGVPQACSRLHEAGFVLVMVTNQPDVARGRSTAEAVGEINAAVGAAAGIDDVRVCFHDDDASCACRKPNPGMLLDASRDLRLDLSASFLVGDRWRDIEAGRRAGVTTVLVDYGYQESTHVVPAKTVGDLTEASEWIITQANSKGGEL